MKIVNLTPHPIVVRGSSGELTFQPSGQVARVESQPGQILDDVQLPLYLAPEWGEVTGIPDAEFGTIYIVSSMVAQRCAGRGDVFSPGTGPADGAIRDADGRITAVTRLIQAPQADREPCAQCNDTGIYNAGDCGGSLCRCSCAAGRARDEADQRALAAASERDRLAREHTVYSVDPEYSAHVKRGEYPPVSRLWRVGDKIPELWLRPERTQVHPVQRIPVNANADYERTWFHQVAVARDGSEYVVLGSYGQCVPRPSKDFPLPFAVCPYCGAPEPFQDGWDCYYCGCN